MDAPSRTNKFRNTGMSFHSKDDSKYVVEPSNPKKIEDQVNIQI